MIKTTQKEIKKHYNGKNDLNTFSSVDFNAIKKDLKTVAMSFGVYGMNGALFIDSNGNYYIIPSISR